MQGSVSHLPAVPLPDVNGYITAADADLFFATSFGAIAWQALNSTEKQVALAEASRALDTLQWWGEKCDPGQPWQWPRRIAAAGTCGAADCTTLPADVVAAVAQLALSLHNDQAALVPALGGSTGVAATGVVTLGPVKRQKVGELEQEYFAPGTGSTHITAKSGVTLPTVLAQFSWLHDVLRCWLVPISTGDSAILQRGTGGCGGGCHRLDGLPFPVPYPVGLSTSSRQLPTPTGMWGDYVDTTGA